MAIKSCNINKADVVRILFEQIYSSTMEQQTCLGFVPQVINMHPGLFSFWTVYSCMLVF